MPNTTPPGPKRRVCLLAGLMFLLGGMALSIAPTPAFADDGTETHGTKQTAPAPTPATKLASPSADSTH